MSTIVRRRNRSRRLDLHTRPARQVRSRWRAAALVVLSATLAAPALEARDGLDGQPPTPTAARRRVGVAFGGGSARGLAHVGVLRWFEEHRIPIDVAAGTSMGGLIGGAYATGMSAAELTQLLQETNWDEMFGFSPFRFKNIRRKDDARDYPSRIEFGIKRGIAPPVALNNGQQVDFLLTRIAGPYGTLASFDDLPTPFRAVASDLVAAQQVVLDNGSLASALRATMSLPGIFPPVERDGRVLVDGGALNNVPADVVRGLGADVVIAINVGQLGERKASQSLLGLIGQTIDVMMLASTRAAMKSADIVIHPALDGFASLDWRRFEELEVAGYRAADAMKETLLPLALDEAQWVAYQEQRRTKRQTGFPTPEFLTIAGVAKSDQLRMEEVLRPLIGQPLDVAALELHIEEFAGLDRYETVGWSIAQEGGRPGLRVEARPKSYAPPFLMLGLSLQNTTTDDFALEVAGRYLAFDVLGSGSELRVDAAVGAQPRIGAELYRPMWRTPLFVAGSVGARHRTLSFVDDDIVVARYSENRTRIGLDVGVNLGRDSDVRVGMSFGSLDASVEAGDPGLPELHGNEARAQLAWRYDGQDSPVVPTGGARATGIVSHIFESPGLPPGFDTSRSNDDITKIEVTGAQFWSLRRLDRVFVSGGLGASWGHPLATEQFTLGAPLRLGAYDVGAVRGDHYGLVTAGYLRGVKRLPDFLGGPIFLGGWIENGSAFDDLDTAKFRTNVSIGTIADTLIGPMILGVSFDFSGAWRYYVGVGRLF